MSTLSMTLQNRFEIFNLSFNFSLSPRGNLSCSHAKYITLVIEKNGENGEHFTTEEDRKGIFISNNMT